MSAQVHPAPRTLRLGPRARAAAKWSAILFTIVLLAIITFSYCSFQIFGVTSRTIAHLWHGRLEIFIFPVRQYIPGSHGKIVRSTLVPDVYSFSLWWAIIPSVVLSGLALRKYFLERRRRRSGNCLRCGYELRGIPASSGCPECGEIPVERPRLQSDPA